MFFYFLENARLILIFSQKPPTHVLSFTRFILLGEGSNSGTTERI